MTDAIRVVHVVLSLDVGGLERMVLDLVREGTRRGQHVSVACVERPGTLASAVEAMGARVVCVDKRAGLRPSSIGRLAMAFRELRPDVVHTHQLTALAYAGPAALAVGGPVVHTEHGKHFASRRRTRLLGRLAGRFVARFLCVSSDIAAEVEAYRIVPRRKIGVVANGIDTARFEIHAGRESTRAALGIAADAIVVGTVGRLNEVKRQDRLIRAFARVRETSPTAQLLLVGDGILMADLRKLAVDLKIESSVHFAGYQTEPEKFLGAMDLFALTSRSEGMPLAILEAWAAGVPVVASRVGGVPEMMADGQTGLLFDPEDENALVAAMGRLIANRDLRRAMVEAGRALVIEKYDLRVMAANYERHYRELLTMERANF